MDKRKRLYENLDILAVLAGIVFVGAKAGRLLIRKYIKQSKHI